MSITIHNKEFKTKKEAEEHIRGIVSSYKIGDMIAADDFWMSLISRHPEAAQKIGCGIAYLSLRQSQMNRNNKELWIIRNDASQDNISWLTCVSGVPQTQESKFKKACRRAVDSQIEQFRSVNEDVPCQLCGGKAWHVDHDNPQFDSIVSAFVSRGKVIIPKEYDDCPKSNSSKFKEQDKDLEEMFSAWHAATCSLRMLCKTCNLTRKRK